MRARLQRLAGRIRRGVAQRRLGGTPHLGPAQGAWLLEDLREDLAGMVDDAENRGVTERAAKEMLAIRSLVVWLEGGEPPGAEAIGYLERAVGVIPHDEEPAHREAYLAAIGDLGGDVEAASCLRPGSRDPEDTRGLPDPRGRRILELTEGRGMTIGDLSRRSGIETVTLVSVLFGREEMDAAQLIRLSGALDVPDDDLLPEDRPPTGDEPEGVR